MIFSVPCFLLISFSFSSVYFIRRSMPTHSSQLLKKISRSQTSPTWTLWHPKIDKYAFLPVKLKMKTSLLPSYNRSVKDLETFRNARGKKSRVRIDKYDSSISTIGYQNLDYLQYIHTHTYICMYIFIIYMDFATEVHYKSPAASLKAKACLGLGILSIQQRTW